MTNIDQVVLTVYERIGALPENAQSQALADWWAYLKDTCSPETPCIECLRELDAQARAEAYEYAEAEGA